MPLTPQDRADRSAAEMWRHDQASPGAGIALVTVAPGEASATLAVEERHLNGHRICHGGYIFMLADTAFAFACNSYNASTVAQTNQITFLSPGRLGDVLTAQAVEVARSGRSGIYDISVRNQNGDQIAEMRGNSRTIQGQHFEEEE